MKIKIHLHRNGFSSPLGFILGLGLLVVVALSLVFLFGGRASQTPLTLSQPKVSTAQQPSASPTVVTTQSDPAQPDSGEKNAFGIPKSPISLKLSISHPPALGDEATLTVSIISTEQAPSTMVQLSLPEGFELVSGSLSWKVDLQPQQELGVNLPIRAVKSGYWTISVFAKHTVSVDPVYWFGDTKYLDLQVADKFGRSGIPSSGSQGKPLIKITPPPR